MNNSRVERGLRVLREGELIVLLDDVHTGIGVLVGTAEHVTPKKVNMMTKAGKGLVSVCLPESVAQKLDLPFMVEDPMKPFTLSVDYKTCTTGISSFERAETIKAFTREDIRPEDFRKPGHVFPLAGKEHGILQRTALVEAVIDLAKETSASPVGYVCEILNQQGEIASIQDIEKLARECGFPVLTVSEIVEMRREDVLCTFVGQVIHGKQIGRKIGFPTANLQVDSKEGQLPNGVYGVNVHYDNRRFLGIMNVGLRPTIHPEETAVHYEVHIFDFDETIYGEKLQIEVGFFVREERSFATMHDLISQIKKDVEFVKHRRHIAAKAEERPARIGGAE
ncbi:3,4-dihydroxy-2-butanone-4-phosphate synthase [Brevibacillus humidisoli]|uniref:3,4-dihydroxy-2-butanone-4-phosphate synthase n=1 Tax=Brevibacillus humidisoli TaxID=2895522 RepID=UPI001E282D83|nr:3,4-dihydroxy-2-butanone-4-phosphate synthase [Brevibacillus humidisoli]UFJ40899.1 3,4-dihydroxy-2-butanone-4-phosphate synthase [Brevibacillus humidisoli]